jgi:hypothetical protein
LIAGSLLLVALPVVGVILLLPESKTVRPEFVGVWRGALYPNIVIKLRADGTFEKSSVEANYHGDKDVRIVRTGTWLAASNAYFLRTVTLEASGLKLGKAAFETSRQKSLGKESKHTIRWTSKNGWVCTDVAMGGFRRM